MRNQHDLLRQFYTDIQISNCIVQVGSVTDVDILLDGENFGQYLQNNQKKDVFFLGGIDPQQKKKRASDKNVIWKNHFFIDLDIRSQEKEITDNDIRELTAWVGEALIVEGGALGKWRYIVFSGNGLHIHYFGDPVEIQSIEDWKNGLKGLLMEAKRILKIDPDSGCINPARLCRCPGSYNNKNGAHKLVEILEWQNASFEITGIEKLGHKTGTTVKNKLPDVVGDTINKGNRDNTLTSIAGSLRSRGLDKDTIFSALTGINQSKCNPPLKQAHIRKIAKSVSRYRPQEAIDAQKKWSLKVTVMDEVEEEDFEWLWNGRIPFGEISILGGNPGDGKSTLSCELASAVTNGNTLIGGGKEIEGNVLIIAAEDSVAKTVKKRLRQSGADQSRVHVVQVARDEHGNKRPISLETDIPLIEELMRTHDYKLVIIDPISAYMGKGTDTYKDSSVRHVLMPLADLAHETNAAIVCVKHLNKTSNTTNALYRISESIGFVGIARTVLFLGKDPDSEQRIIDVVKSNAGAIPKAVAFEIKDGCFRWIGETDMRASQVLGGSSGSTERENLLDEAKDLLLHILLEKPLPISTIRRYAKEASISWRTMERAKTVLGILSDRVSVEEGWSVWKLPSRAKSAQHAVYETVAELEGENISIPLPEAEKANATNSANTPKSAKPVQKPTKTLQQLLRSSK
jgi:archaellum biogenesis ATPase FlaH